ncbi:sodium:glutamate symporter [Pontibacillus halophilus JSM 076056 = DSM 19796]|uniref:Sodium:glutamate symporter n=2 Tax=Pontibacillus TaxID=289201 RepID=A0A0A5GGI5_9BACI|nr:sodium:glutamate symporter [Pontibacillus halophilus JSM 076056 = DSM 19796]
MCMTVWNLMLDLGFIAALLLVGVVLRAKVTFLQKLFLPASIIAGLLGLALGPSGFGWIPFSEFVSQYPGVLIAIIFGAIPIGQAAVKWSETIGRVRNMWIYSMAITILMWGGGALFGLAIVNNIWDTPTGFGLMLGAGFVGGHGTAAAIGEGFSSLGWEEATTLGYTSATVGILASVIGGMLFIKYSARKKKTSFISDFNDLPAQLRTGLVPKSQRKSMGDDTVSTISIDPFVFHVSLISLVILVSYFTKMFIESMVTQINIPLLSLAFVIGILFQFILRKTGGAEYVDKRVMDRIGSTATDLLVAFGIASINLSVVLDYAVPLIALLLFGIVWAFLIYNFVAPRIFKKHVFENAIFGWGWSTGTVAMGMALLRVADPDSKSTTLDDYALGYIAMVPVEVAIVTFGPIAMMAGAGAGWMFTSILLGTLGLVFAIAFRSNWLVKPGSQGNPVQSEATKSAM